MFDLNNDPNELVSIYGKPEAAETQKKLEAELKRLRTLYKLPAKDPKESFRKPRKKKKPAKKKAA